MLEQEVESPRSRICRSRGWDWRSVFSESFGSGAASTGAVEDSGESLEGGSQAPASRWGAGARLRPSRPRCWSAAAQHRPLS